MDVYSVATIRTGCHRDCRFKISHDMFVDV